MKFPKFFLFAVSCGILFPSAIFSQQATAISPTMKTENQWRPAKIQNDGNNSMNGVKFFRKPSSCDSKKVVLIKAVNTNPYPVRINWKENNTLQRSVVVPASSEIEGNCTAYNGNDNNAPQKMLVIEKKEKETIKGDNKKLISDLMVLEEKK